MPAYHVTLKAQNRAGLFSDPFHLAPVLVVAGDKAGTVRDGPGTRDIGAQTDRGVVRASFEGFQSPSSGIRAFQVAVGSQAGWDDVQPFSENGVTSADGANF